MIIHRPTSDQYNSYYDGYIDLVVDPVELLIQQKETLVHYVTDNQERLGYAYAEGKWTIRKVIMHICDVELIFLNRMLRCSRGDTTPMPAFDHNAYVNENSFEHLDLEALTKHFEAIRNVTLSAISALRVEDIDRKGVASGHPISVRALIYIIAGHCKHHHIILKERY